MARGFESKQVESQQEEAARGRTIDRPAALGGGTGSSRPAALARAVPDAPAARAQPCNRASTSGDARTGNRGTRGRARRFAGPFRIPCRRVAQPRIAAFRPSRCPIPAASPGMHLASSTSRRGMPHTRNVVRLAAIGDLHYGRTAIQGSLHPLFSQINESADILILCGDLTDYGTIEEGRALVRELAVTQDSRCRSPRQSRLRIRPAGAAATDARSTRASSRSTATARKSSASDSRASRDSPEDLAVARWARGAKRASRISCARRWTRH